MSLYGFKVTLLAFSNKTIQIIAFELLFLQGSSQAVAQQPLKNAHIMTFYVKKIHIFVVIFTYIKN